MSSTWTKNDLQVQRTLKVDKILIRAFRASDDVESSRRFASAYAEVLSNHGIKKVSSSTADWIGSSDVYVIVAQSPSGHRIYGGARIEIKNDINKLPLQKAFERFDPRINDIIDEMKPEGCAELCALWNSIEVAGLGIGSRLIITCGLSLIESLNIRYFFALTSPVTRRFMPDFGFINVDEIGENGGIPYPNERLIATAALHTYPENTNLLNDEIRDQVKQMRKTPIMTDKTTGPKGDVTIYYDLKVSR